MAHLVTTIEAESASADSDCPRKSVIYHKKPYHCVDAESGDEVAEKCCGKEGLCLIEAREVIEDYEHRFINVFVSKCGLNRESDLAESADGGEVQVINPEPLCSVECQDLEELHPLADGMHKALSEECMAFSEVVEMVEESEYVMLAKAVDEAWATCPEGMPSATSSTVVAPTASTSTMATVPTTRADPERDCPDGFFPRQCLVEGNKDWKQRLDRHGCRGNLLVLQLPKSLAGIFAAVTASKPHSVLLRVTGTNSITDWTREIPRGLEISEEQLPKHLRLEATRGVTIKHKDGLALDLDVLGTDGSVKKTFVSATSLTLAPRSKSRSAHVLYTYKTINPLWHLGHLFGLNGLYRTELVRVPTVADSLLMACSDGSAAHVDEPDPERSPSPPPSPSDSWDWPSDDEDDDDSQEQAEEAGKPEAQPEPSVPTGAHEKSSPAGAHEQSNTDDIAEGSFPHEPEGFTGHEHHLYSS